MSRDEIHLKLFLRECSIATMTDYLSTETVDIIIEYGRNNENARECARLYAFRFPNRRHPSRQTISNLIARALDGRLRHQRKKKDRTEETVLNIAILGMVAFNPHVSQRRINLELHTLLSTVNRVLRANHFSPYHINPSSVQRVFLGTNEIFKSNNFRNQKGRSLAPFPKKTR